MTLRERARLALEVLGDAASRFTYPREFGTPREHADRFSELFGLGRGHRARSTTGGPGVGHDGRHGT